MNQPKILINGEIYTVASIWWVDGEIHNITYILENSVDTIFGPHEYLKSLLIKEA
ncbi:hypothetical protein [Bacillus methanolicus]|uniref:hypothetical protein n=1 Tax=Bacillus methanolicus TaxID=1471 RepID=UPI0023806E67|nr:hypothetical protein [Bacillus methanolicus]